MELEANKAICDRIAEAVSRRDAKALEALVSPEVAASFRAALAELFAAFPDLHGASLEQIAEGDKVVCRWVFLGTHSGPYRGVEASGKSVTFSGVSIARIAGGRVVSLLCLLDEQQLIRQLASDLPHDALESLYAAISFSLRGQGKRLN